MEIKNLENELNSLAYHGRRIIIGKSADGKIGYRAFYNLEGDFLFVKLYKHNRQRALLPWKVEYDIETVEKIDKYDENWDFGLGLNFASDKKSTFLKAPSELIGCAFAKFTASASLKLIV